MRSEVGALPFDELPFDELPFGELLSALTAAEDGWACAQAVRVDGHIVDFRLVFLNEPGARALGRPAAELLNCRYLDLWPSMAEDGLISDYAEVVERRKPLTRQFYYDDGALVGYFEVRVRPVGDGIAVCFTNVSRAGLDGAGGRARSEAEGHLRAALDAAFDGFCVLRGIRDGGVLVDFEITYVNETGAKLAGLEVRELVGGRLTEVAPEEVTSGRLAYFQRVVESGESYLDEVGDPDTGSVWEIKTTRIAEDVAALSYRDVTDRVRQSRRIRASESDARLAAARTSALQAATAALARSVTVADVYAVMTEQVRPLAGWQSLVVMLRADGHLAVSHASGLTPTAVDALRDTPLDDRHPMATVVRSRRPLFYPDEESYVADFPERAVPVRAAGRGAWAFVPLLAAGSAVGAMEIGYLDRRDFDEREREALVSLGELYAQAIERARLFESQRSIAADLQHALLPAQLPSIAGARHAARYLPWTHGAEVGGDWYDIIPLSDDSVGVAIGDVAGHSISAAATMGQLRNALRAYALDGHSPTNVMERVNRLLVNVEPDAMATCCYLELHLAERTATIVLAGHLAPMLCFGGTVESLDLRLGVPLGVSADARYVDTSLPLPPGAALMLFTDGLVEDRRFPIGLGMAQLRSALLGVDTQDPAALVARVLAANVGPRPRSDDVALLAISLDPPAIAAGPPTATRVFRSDATSVAAARRLAADMLTAWGSADLVDVTRLLLGEVITNAVQHTVGDVRVRLTLADQRLRVEVRDGSERLPSVRTVDTDSESGRGLHIVASLADAWGSDSHEAGGKVVWFELATET